MTTSPVMTVTDELLADIEAAAGNAHIARSGHDWFSPEDCHWWTGNADEGDFISAASPKAITALTAELRRLRAENAELAKDAGRYQWLRNQSMEYRQNGPAAIMAEVSGEKGTFLELDDLDAAIDTAMATHRGEA